MSDRFLIKEYTHSSDIVGEPLGEPELHVVSAEELLEFLDKAHKDRAVLIAVSKIGPVLLDWS